MLGYPYCTPYYGELYVIAFNTRDMGTWKMIHITVYAAVRQDLVNSWSRRRGLRHEWHRLSRSWWRENKTITRWADGLCGLCASVFAPIIVVVIFHRLLWDYIQYSITTIIVGVIEGFGDLWYRANSRFDIQQYQVCCSKHCIDLQNRIGLALFDVIIVSTSILVPYS